MIGFPSWHQPAADYRIDAGFWKPNQRLMNFCLCTIDLENEQKTQVQSSEITELDGECSYQGVKFYANHAKKEKQSMKLDCLNEVDYHRCNPSNLSFLFRVGRGNEQVMTSTVA